MNQERVQVMRMTPPRRGSKELSNPASYSGRAHVAGDDVPLYASEDAATARKEFRHHHPDFVGTEVRLTTLAGSLLVMDATDNDVIEAAGVVAADLVDEDPSHCQRFAAWAWAEGAQAIRLPSARGNGTNIVVAHASLGHLQESDVGFETLR